MELYTGTFNWYQEIETVYRYARSEGHAKTLMTRHLAKKKGVLPSVTAGYFNGKNDNFKIERGVRNENRRSRIS